MDGQRAHDERLQRLLDRAEIVELIDRWFLCLDLRDVGEERARFFFTGDARSETPLGDHDGLADLVEGTRVALGRFDRTQHVGANHVVDIDGDHAAVRWNAVMTHVHPASRGAAQPFVVGGYWEGDAVRTPEGWRFRRIAVHPVWTTGEPPVLTPPPGD
ncbi:nuclear transport factor 2 family protein [Streptomyces sp. PTM05]|uniref:Nuclear transport factor 2 family protein n=1 Tax=Streptantibioticus parmotrematis TaxID=2873249 RepID=A0ABS7QP85_9ACTN|nr:nuclear transport factor 2 family protein [Streptantibioticus parmotrematis]MBY8884993.1 nuclear transport factor 2 family protein [Streptantibioticus parmotrematis]